MTAHASPVDTEAHGEHTIRRRDGDPRCVHRFAGRVREPAEQWRRPGDRGPRVEQEDT